MHTFTASLTEVAVLGVGMTLLVAWITYIKTARIKASLLDLAQEDAQTSSTYAEIEAASGDALRSVPSEKAARGGV